MFMKISPRQRTQAMRRRENAENGLTLCCRTGRRINELVWDSTF